MLGVGAMKVAADAVLASKARAMTSIPTRVLPAPVGKWTIPLRGIVATDSIRFSAATWYA